MNDKPEIHETPNRKPPQGGSGTAPPQRKSTLQRLEAKAEKAGLAFAEALVEIYDGEHYKEAATSWEEYVAARWNVGRSQAWYTLSRCRISTLVGADLPDTWARELARFTPADQVRIWELAQHYHAQTAGQLRDLIASLSPEEQAQMVGGEGKPAPRPGKSPWEKTVLALRRARKHGAGLDVADRLIETIDLALRIAEESTERVAA